jgi:hypothetical protein
MLENYTEGAISDRKAREILTLIVYKTIDRGIGQYTVGYEGSLVRIFTLHSVFLYWYNRITGQAVIIKSLPQNNQESIRIYPSPIIYWTLIMLCNGDHVV